MSLKMMRVVPRGGGDWCVTSERKVHLQGVSALAIARMVSVGVDWLYRLGRLTKEAWDHYHL